MSENSGRKREKQKGIKTKNPASSPAKRLGEE